LTTQYAVPLEIKYQDSTFIPLKKAPQQVTSLVEGRGWHILNVLYFTKTTPVVVNFKKPGLNSKLDTANLKQKISAELGSVRIKRVLLDTLDLPFDKKASKWIYMKIDLNSIALAKGFEKEKGFSFDPDRVRVMGPKSIIDTISDTLKIKVPYGGLDKNFDESFKLGYYLRNSYLVLSHEKVNVQFKVRRKQTSYAN